MKRVLWYIPSRVDTNEWVFEHCVGMVDGTLIVLKDKPALHRVESQSYFNYRKQKYGFQATIICDDEGRILKFNCNFPGSVHDARAWRKLGVYQHPRQYLQGEEFLLADSAYPLTETTIVPFKHSSVRLSQEKRIFNQKLSGLRVSVEHCIGRLKARFPSLRGLPHRIQGQRDVTICLMWIGSCVVLHNLLMDLDDEIEPRWEMPEDNESSDEDENIVREERSSGKRKRDALMQAVLEEVYEN